MDFWTPPRFLNNSRRFTTPKRAKEWPWYCRKVYWTKMAPNGQNDLSGQNDLILNRILVFARPKWTILVHFGLKRFGPFRSASRTLATPARCACDADRRFVGVVCGFCSLRSNLLQLARPPLAGHSEAWLGVAARRLSGAEHARSFLHKHAKFWSFCRSDLLARMRVKRSDLQKD